MRWRDRIGIFHRDLGDGEYAEIVIVDRTYRVRVGDLAWQRLSAPGTRDLRALRQVWTAAAYTKQAFVKLIIANWGDASPDYAVGFICGLGSPNLKFICRTVSPGSPLMTLSARNRASGVSPVGPLAHLA